MTATGPGPRPLLKPALAAGSWRWTANAVLALGGASLVLFLGLDTLRVRLAASDFGLVRAVAEVRSDIAVAHLWIELATGGHESGEDVWRPINRSLTLSQAMVEGGEVGSGAWVVTQIEDPALRREAADLRSGLQRFAEVTLRRQGALARGEAVGPGSPLDTECDRLFREVLRAADRLQAGAEAHLQSHQDRFRLAVYLVLVAWALVVATAFWSLRRFESRRQRAEAILRDRDLQLVQVQKMEAVGRLAGGMAHDINNYLAAIRAQAELVKRKPLPAERLQEKMGAVIATVDKASGLIQRLLAFARRQPIHPEVVGLNLVVDGLGPLMEQTLGEDIRVETALQRDLWSVRIDPGQLEQILVNLLVNAREAMPHGGTVRVETANATLAAGVGNRPVGTGGDYVVLTVSDSGPGIPAEVIDKLFEPFFTTKGERGNSGLGLATVYGIVKQNGGNVWAENAASGGAIFRVYLPRSHDHRSTAARPATRAGESCIGDERVLLVEDNRDVLEATRALLEASGYRVTAAASGDEALRALAAGGPVDVVVTDVVMPGMSGPEVVARIRERWGELPVVFVSGYSDSVAGARGVLQSGALLLQKPFTAEALCRQVRAALQQPPSSPAG